MRKAPIGTAAARPHPLPFPAAGRAIHARPALHPAARASALHAFRHRAAALDPRTTSLAIKARPSLDTRSALVVRSVHSGAIRSHLSAAFMRSRPFLIHLRAAPLHSGFVVTLRLLRKFRALDAAVLLTAMIAVTVVTVAAVVHAGLLIVSRPLGTRDFLVVTLFAWALGILARSGPLACVAWSIL